MSKLSDLLNKLCPNGVCYEKLGNLVEIVRGRRVTKEQIKGCTKYPVFQNSLSPMGYYDSFNFDGEKTYIIVAGAAGEIGYCKTPFWAADDCFVIQTDVFVNKFIYYWLINNQDFIKSMVRKASVPRLSRDVIEGIKTPVLPKQIQELIVAFLDEYSSLEIELEEKLVSELDLRKRKYKHYLNEVLTFKENKK